MYVFSLRTLSIWLFDLLSICDQNCLQRLAEFLGSKGHNQKFSHFLAGLAYERVCIRFLLVRVWPPQNIILKIARRYRHFSEFYSFSPYKQNFACNPRSVPYNGNHRNDGGKQNVTY